MVQPVTVMTKAALGVRLALGADEYLDMFHDDAVFEFPFGIGGPVHVEGKPAMAAYLAKIEGATIFNRFDLKAAYPIRDDGMVLEYHCQMIEHEELHGSAPCFKSGPPGHRLSGNSLLHG